MNDDLEQELSQYTLPQTSEAMKSSILSEIANNVDIVVPTFPVIMRLAACLLLSFMGIHITQNMCTSRSDTVAPMNNHFSWRQDAIDAADVTDINTYSAILKRQSTKAPISLPAYRSRLEAALNDNIDSYENETS